MGEETTRPELFPFTNDGYIERVVTNHAVGLRWSVEMKEWQVYGNKSWAADKSGEVGRRILAAIEEGVAQARAVVGLHPDDLRRIVERAAKGNESYSIDAIQRALRLRLTGDRTPADGAKS